MAEFRSENGAALIANLLWSALHAHTVSLTIEDERVALDHAAIKDALLRSARGTDVAA